MNLSKIRLYISVIFLFIILSFSIVTTAAGNLTLTVIANKNNISVGDDIDFTISLSDASTTDLSAFAFKITLPDGMVYKPGSGSITQDFRNATGMATMEFDEEPYLMVSGFGANPYNGGAIDIAVFTCVATAAGQMNVTLSEVELLNESVRMIPSAIAPVSVNVSAGNSTGNQSGNKENNQIGNQNNGAVNGQNSNQTASDTSTNNNGGVPGNPDTSNNTQNAQTGGASNNNQQTQPNGSSQNPPPAPPVIPEQEQPSNSPANVPQRRQPGDVSGAGGWINPFIDVMETDWFYDNVAWVNLNNLMYGTEETLFNPDAPMTRAMLVAVLYRYAGSPAPDGENTFSDVPAGEWYTDAVVWAAQNDIVKGVSATVFSPEDNITREQIATLFFRYAGYTGADVSARGELNRFADASDVADYAADAVAWAVASGIITGKPGGFIDPRADATRAEVAAILQRYTEANI